MNATMVMQKNGLVRVGAIILAAILAVGVVSYMATPDVADAKTYKIKTAKQWHDIGKHKGGTFKVMKNIKLTNEKQYLNITKKKRYIIDLNGHTVKTTYSGVPLRTVCPINITKGTVYLKSSKKKKGVLYSTETAAVNVMGTGKFIFKSGTIVNDATEFRSDITSGIFGYGKAKIYIKGKDTRLRSIGNGIALFERSKLYVTGNPYVRAGANEYTGQFTHYGSAVSIASKTARAYLRGGSFGTKASQDTEVYSPAITMTYTQSGNYPILDMYGKAIKGVIPKGYKCVNARGQAVPISATGADSYYNGITAPDMGAIVESMGIDYPRIQKYSTTVKSADGYYTVYVRK